LRRCAGPRDAVERAAFAKAGMPPASSTPG
jgi:hypothetical protein